MRIAVIGSRHILSNYGGIERGLKSMLPHLVRLGHDITVYGSPMPDGSMGTGTVWEGVKLVAVPALAGKHTETLSRTMVSVARAVVNRYDVVHYQHQGPGILVPMTRLANIPSVVTVCGLDWQRDKWGVAAKTAIRAAEWVGARSASATIVLSKKIQRYFRATYGVETTHIRNGIEHKKVEATNCVEALGLRPGGYVLFAARLVPEKGAHDLIAAWKMVATDKILVIAGGARYDDDYVRSLHAMADPGRVKFTGHVSGELLEQLFAHAWLFVLPSYIEGLSIALLEAMGHGRAALVSDIPENMEVIEENGFHFSVGNVGDLAEKLAWLTADAAAVEAMEARLARVVGALATWPQIAQQHEQVYRRVLEGTPGRAARMVPEVHAGELAVRQAEPQ